MISCKVYLFTAPYPVKIRLFISELEKIIRIVPMCVPSVASDSLKNISNELHDDLVPIYQKYSKNLDTSSLFPKEALFNFFTFLISFEHYLYVQPLLMRILNNYIINTPQISDFDLRLLFGRDMGKNLLSDISPLLKTEIYENSCNEENTVPFVFKEKVVEDIYSKLKDVAGKFENQEFFYEIIRVLEELIEKSRTCNYKRLRNGITLFDFKYLISKLSSKDVSLEEISFYLDFYIDSGALVPVVEEYNGIYTRTYRKGEADNIEFANFVHVLLERREFAGKPYLSKTQLTKVLSFLAIRFRKENIIPVKPLFKRRGVVPFMVLEKINKTQTYEALSYLSHKGMVNFISPPEENQEPLFDWGDKNASL